MFTKPLEYIITPNALKQAYNDINKNSSGIDDITFTNFEEDFNTNISTLVTNIIKDEYIPEPIEKIDINKPNSNETRPIALSSLKDKIVQKVLYNDLNLYFNKIFSSNSYAYRPNKSTLDAIQQTSKYIKTHQYILKADIDNFFETIDHNKLLAILDKHIKDKSIIRLISLFLQIGGFAKQNYSNHFEGVYQGDILSPLLSNIYLNEMDKFLEEKDIYFIRYADDFILFCKSKQQSKDYEKLLKKFLKTLNLKIQKEKTIITNIKSGFNFLGINFRNNTTEVQASRLAKSISKLENLSKTKQGFKSFIEDINYYLNGLKNYYLKILDTNSPNYLQLQSTLIDTISHKVYLSKKNKKITTKKEFKILLSQIDFYILFDTNQDKYIDLIISKAYERYKSEKSYIEPISKINKQKNKYSKKFASQSTLHIATPGMFIGISKNKFTIKKYGKVQNTYPIDKIRRIILEGKGYSLSSNVIARCAKQNISIDFINRDFTSYAQLITYKSSISTLIHKQALILNTPIQLTLAKEFIKGKAKNQINYIKYLDKYHKILEQNITKMETILKQSKKATTSNELMGYEGSISSIYWESIRLILDAPFEKRITYGAKDIVNSSLNYGYAILYGVVQSSLVQAGLSLNISFLHSLDKQKPTLTFDMIEEFRSFIVDRTIFAMINKDEPIKLDNDGLLTKKSRQLISKNIKEKLGSYTMWKKQSVKVENIIQTQCYKLAKVVNNPKNNKYKAFIGKY